MSKESGKYMVWVPRIVRVGGLSFQKPIPLIVFSWTYCQWSQTSYTSFTANNACSQKCRGVFLFFLFYQHSRQLWPNGWHVSEYSVPALLFYGSVFQLTQWQQDLVLRKALPVHGRCRITNPEGTIQVGTLRVTANLVNRNARRRKMMLQVTCFACKLLPDKAHAQQVWERRTSPAWKRTISGKAPSKTVERDQSSTPGPLMFRYNCVAGV